MHATFLPRQKGKEIRYGENTITCRYLNRWLSDETASPEAVAQTEDYGMDEIRANALYKLTSDYSVSVLQEWREEGGSICHLLEVTAGNTEYANGLLRMNVIDEIILYVVPTIDGNGAHFFKSALPMNDWRLMENKTYRDGVIRLTYHKEPRA